VQATHDTAKPKAKVPPVVKRNVWGTYVDELVSYTVKKPRKIATRYYAQANHLYSPSAVTNSAGQVVSRFSYDAYGKQSILNAAGSGVVASDPAELGHGFTCYVADNETGLF
jgi:hypothetical protein